MVDQLGLRNRKFHELLAQQASSTAPTPSWGAALARALQGGIAGMIENRDNQSEIEANKWQAGLLGPQAAAQPRLSQAYGPEGAAKAWFAGERGMNKPNRSDQLGTTVSAYADRFNRAGGSQPQPLAVALQQPDGALPPQAQPIEGRAQPQQMAQAPDANAALRAQIQQGLTSPNPAVRRQAQALAAGIVNKQLEGDKPTDEIREYNLYKQQGGTKNFFDYKADLKKAGSTQVTTNVGGGSDKQIFDAMAEGATTARTTAAGLTSLREARAALQGGAITGAGAEQILGLQKIGSLLGVANSDKIVNTETFRAAIAPQVASVLKNTVGTANISNTDREFAERAAGGDIKLEGKTIARLLDIMERGSVGVLEGHQKRLEKVYPDAEKYGRERALFGVDMPAVIPPPAATAPAQQGGVIRWEKGPDGKPRRAQ